MLSYACYSVRYCYTFNITIIKGAVSYALYAVGDNYAFKRTAIFECVIAYAYHAVGYICPFKVRAVFKSAARDSLAIVMYIELHDVLRIKPASHQIFIGFVAQIFYVVICGITYLCSRKGVFTYACHRVGDRHGSHGCARGKRFFAYARDAFFDHHFLYQYFTKTAHGALRYRTRAVYSEFSVLIETILTIAVGDRLHVGIFHHLARKLYLVFGSEGVVY